MLFYILKIKSKIISILPRTICLYAGIILGYAMYWLFPLRKKVALTNLRIAFPQKPSNELKNPENFPESNSGKMKQILFGTIFLQKKN